MFGLMLKSTHEAEIAIERARADKWQDICTNDASVYRSKLHAANAELAELRAFKEKVLNPLKAANEARRVKREVA